MERLLHREARKRSAAATALRIAGTTVGVCVVAFAVILLVWGESGEWGLFETAQRSLTTPQRLRVHSLDQLQKTGFFDPRTHKPKVWYSITAAGRLELFSAPGRHPDSGETLKPITTVVVQQLERRLRVQAQEQVAEAERRAATARADAEIARAHRAQSQASVMPDTAPRAQASTTPNTEQQRVATMTAGSPRREAPPAAPRDSPAPASRGERYDAPRGYDAPGMNEDARRATQYNELVATARALIDAGRYSEAQVNAERAIAVDPRRMAGRSLWAEAQTKLDESQWAFARPRRRWPY